jgi:integrase
MGTVRKRGKTWQIDYVDPTGKRVRQSFKKKREAEAELAKRVSLIAEKRYLDIKPEYKTTLSELLDRYEANYRDQASFATWKRCCIVNFRSHFGQLTLLSNIRYAELETYRNHLRGKPTKAGKPRTPAAVNREIAALHHIFAKGVEWDLMEANPFTRGKSLLMKENNKRLRFLSEKEIELLLAECPKHLRRIVSCALLTGMRRGEILSLSWDQIRNGFIYLTKTKTNEAREIPVNEELARLFSEIRHDQPPGTKAVFTYRNGEVKLKGPEPMRPRPVLSMMADEIRDIKTSFKAACRRSGIEDFRFHDLRHTFASHLVMRGASIKQVQELLGHRTLTMTLRYAHLSAEEKTKAASLLNGLTATKNPAGGSCHKTAQTAFPTTSETAAHRRSA